MLGVVIVTYRPPAGSLRRAVRSVLSAGGVDLVVVVDHGGLAAVELADELAADHDGPRLELVTPARNGGFGAGVNVGAARCLDAGATAVAVLNDDLHVEPDWVAPLLAALAADPSVGAVQPKLLYADRVERTVNSMGVELDAAGAGADIGIGRPDGPEFTEPRDIPLFTGGAVVFRREFLEQVGLFAERYFLYYEDVELGLRGARAGYRYRCEPASVVWHEGSATTATLGDRTRYLQERNRLRVLARHGSPAALGRGTWLSVRRLRHAPKGVHAKALAAGIVGMPGELWRRALSRP
ncbi:MAG: glycosyltransferase family 2 protein [Ilumatobacteraceae bacterium]